MGFFDDIFGDKKKAGGGGGGGDNNNNRKNSNNNPLANMRRNIEQTIGGKPKMSGPGRSLGGSKPGTVYVVTLERPGPVGIRVEKRSNTSASAIVNTVVEGSQAEAAGLKRGDVLCFAGSNGQDEIPYDMFLEIVRSPQRPIHLEARRLDQSIAAAAPTKSTGSADAEARRRAMIAAAERREKKHKSQTKTIKHVTKSTLLKQQQQQESTVAASGPQTEESRMAAAAAKRDEANLAAELGYNPYEAIKKTAGQARSATTATQHGAITAPGGGVGGNITPTVPLPVVAPPSDLDAHAAVGYDDDPRFHDFEVALATVASSSDPTSAKNGLKIARKLVTNATTKGQQLSSNDADKFRRVRLANPKIRAAIAEVPGNLDLMLAVGFQLATDDAAASDDNDNDNDESLLVFPAGTKGPAWLPRALAAMEAAETSIVVGS